MKLIFRFKIRLMVFLGSILPLMCYSYGSSMSTPSPSPPTPPSTTTPSTTTPPKATPKPPKKIAPALKTPNLERKSTENYYKQPEEAPPSASAHDSQEILSLIEEQMTAIQTTDISRAYYHYTANQFREATSLDEFKYFVESFPVFSKNKSALFGNLEFKEGIASMQGTLTAATGETLKVEYDFVKEGPQWKIIGIQLLKPTGQQENEILPQSYNFQQDIFPNPN